MQWTKLKKKIQSFWPEAIKKRVDFYMARYRTPRENHARAVLLIDGKEVYDFACLVFENEVFEESIKIRGGKNDVIYSDPVELEESRDVRIQAKKNVQNKGIYCGIDFTQVLEGYCSMSVDEILSSEDFVVKMFAILDKRVGKRRLKILKEKYSTPSILNQLYNLRCELEGIFP